jgi:hypothetical protein
MISLLDTPGPLVSTSRFKEQTPFFQVFGVSVSVSLSLFALSFCYVFG